MCHLRSAFKTFFPALVDSAMTKFSSRMTVRFREVISRDNHSDKIDIVTVDTNKPIIDYQKHKLT
jgi:hypothetical protein